MGEHVIKLPDVGEGVAEAELVEWHVKVGDLVREDAVLAAVMTDKATVEIPSPVDGEVVWLGAEIGDTVAVGSPIVRLKVEAGEGGGAAGTAHRGTGSASEDEAAGRPAASPTATPTAIAPSAQPGRAARGEARRRQRRRAGRPRPSRSRRAARRKAKSRSPRRPCGCARGRPASTCARSRAADRPAASPMRTSTPSRARAAARARCAGLQRERRGRGHQGRRPAPQDRREDGAGANRASPTSPMSRRSTSPRSRSCAPRSTSEKRPDQPKLTLLPFLMRAMVKAIAEQPRLNALFDDEAGVIHQHGGVHIGIATQTPAGLMVPVVRHAEARDLWDCARGGRTGSPRPREPAPRRARSSPARPSPSPRSARWAAS